jgi:quercetin dioxygenase-like cupin family protein
MKIEVNLTDLAYSQESVIAKAIAGTDNFKIMQIVLSKGQELKTHTSPVDAILMIIEGEVEYKEGSEVLTLKAFDVFSIKKDIQHSVSAKENSRILLTR